MHHQPIPSGYARVGISYSTEMDTLFPVPLEGEAVTIKEAIGTLVFWPIELIVLDTAVKTIATCAKISSKDNEKQVGSIKTPAPSTGESHKVEEGCEDIVNVATLPECLYMFHMCVSKMERREQIKIFIEIGITTQIKDIFLGKKELIRLLAQEQLELPQTYMSKLYDKCCWTRCSALFGFLCRSGISLVTQFKRGESKKVKECKRSRMQYIVDTLKETTAKEKIFIAPYNIGYHWVLCVIDPYNNTVYYLDSLRTLEFIRNEQGIIGDLLENVNTALFQFQSERELATKLKMSTKWLKIQCPFQEDYIKCGYYVMRFMKEIISHKRLQIPEVVSLISAELFCFCKS
ncbi:uncharacterized protein [Spinacia oleracea]|uniref:Ubiquitin-like protease family profile domain-containing protein n=1 Tax=Spinacia oleracea TaxID=3562 RepID=A0ABM3RI73_SPIOL|nr:uncharacterized protein LOC130469834 [Spinacia oleracea]